MAQQCCPGLLVVERGMSAPPGWGRTISFREGWREMKRSLVVGTFAACAATSGAVAALDSVPSMLGSDTLKSLTLAIVSQCSDLSGYPIVPPIVYNGTGSTSGENAMKFSGSTQRVAPMSRALGRGVCSGDAPRGGAEGIVFALDALNIVMASSVAGAEGIDYTGAPGDPSNNWRTVLRQIYTGMGPTGNDIFARDCNSAARRALVDNWDNLFRGSTGTTCSDSNPDSGAANVEPGLRHAFRRDEESGASDVLLAQLGLPAIDFMQQAFEGDLPPPFPIPSGSNALQTAVYRALANSPFCNVRRPEDDYPPVTKGGSQIPPMYQVGVPTGAGTGLGLVPYNPALGSSARFLSPYMPEQMDQDPIRRKCFGPRVSIADSPNLPREQVCSADGALGLVLPISIPPGLTTAEHFPSIPCDDTRDFEFGPTTTRPTGDPERCPNGDAPQDGRCFLPNRTDATQPGGFAFDCLNNGLNSPAAVFDADGNGSEYPDAPNTDGRADADGRAYNLILRRPNGQVRAVTRPNPEGRGTMTMPVVGAFYRLHSSRSGLPAPNHTRNCQRGSADDQIGCLVQLNPCSLGYAGGSVTMNNPGTVAALVNGVAPSTASVQALVKGGTTYPLARRLYLNSVAGFETLLTSSDPGLPTFKDAELDLAECFSHLPFSTFASVGGAAQLNVASYGLVPLPAPSSGGAARALCEDFDGRTCSDATNADACRNNTGLIPTSACNNGLRDGDEAGVDVCPAARPTCVSGSCQ